MVEEVKKHWFIVNSEKRAFVQYSDVLRSQGTALTSIEYEKQHLFQNGSLKNFAIWSKWSRNMYFIYNTHIVMFLLFDF